MAFRWRADGGPLIVVLGSSLPSSTKKRCESWTPSDKTFWIRACKGAKLFFVALDKPHGFIYGCVMVNHMDARKLVFGGYLLFDYWKHVIYTFLLTTIVIASPGLHGIRSECE